MGHKTRMVAVAALLGILTLGAGAGGCAGSKTTTTTVRTEGVEQPVAPLGADNAQETRTAEGTTTTTTTEKESSSPGIIGSAFQLVWAVISFPFRVLGALF